MDFRVGIVITSLLLGTVQPNPSHVCASFTDLSEPCGCILSHETFDPICGSDGHTYLNVCFLECRKTIDMVDISIDYRGVCTKEFRCTCHARYDPMCGSNGVTYSNDCVLNCYMKKDGRIRLKHVGECGSTAGQRPNQNVVTKLTAVDSKKCECAAMHRPVCANNHRTYANFCVLDCSSKKEPGVRLLHWGDCSNTQ